MFLNNDLAQCFLEVAKQDKGIFIVTPNEADNKYISYSDVLKKSLMLGKCLQKLGAEKGTEVIIQCKEVSNFIYSFWACILCGFVAVPVDVNNSQYKENMKQNFLSKLDHPIILTDISEISDIYGNVKNKVQVITDNIWSAGELYDSKDICFDLNDIIYIQFSSGSTSEPKGVVVRKSNVYADTYGIALRQKLTKEDVILTWQPLTHCYGLIVFHILPIMLGINQYIIPTSQFMHSPLFWMEAANKYRATRLGTIPFALKHFMDIYQRNEKRYDWDLSCIKSILIGAEQISGDLCNRFTDEMAANHLGKNTIMPLYGLAETVVITSLHNLNEPLRNHRILRDCLDIGKPVITIENADDSRSTVFLEIGEPVTETQIGIFDDKGNDLGERVIGRICVKGSIVTTGYYKNEDSTKRALTEDGWLDTGDVGFLSDGKLTIVGRVKELVIINGKKYSCNDIESVISTKVDKKNFGQIVVCSGFDSKDNLEKTIIFVENSEGGSLLQEFNRLTRDIKEVLYEVFEITIDNVVLVDKIPKTFSGKTKRVELMKKYLFGECKTSSAVSFQSDFLVDGSADEVLTKVIGLLKDTIERIFTIKIIDPDTPFKEYGIISINIPYFLTELNAIFSLNLSTTDFFNYPTINKLAGFICESLRSKKKKEIMKLSGMSTEDKNEKIAIVGMSCRFPGGANSVDEFWDVLMNGKDGIGEVPESRWDVEKYYAEDDNAPGKMYCRKGGFLNVPIDEFDAGFFNISPKEATALDPQQRLVLELVWEAFENAQIPVKKYNGSDAGVFLGISTDEYALAHIYSGELSRIDAYSLTGMCKSTACGRISYTFGFEGPSIAVDTACSSTLSAMHIACNALKQGETSLAVVAGINLIISPATNIGFSKLHATSRDGYSKSFDESANGYGRGEGGGVLILKKLSDAVRDEDNILGVILSTSINQDGASNGLTAPNGLSQEKLIQNALKKAHIEANDVNYIEMHGTGTKLGDPIEVNAIINTYCKDRSDDNTLRIGSVKSNIGHLEAGAGIASVIKILLSLKHNLIPSNLHFINPNSLIDWDAAAIQVVGEHTEWKRDHDLRRAGINGFGFGGSNAHVILEEYIPEEKERKEEKGLSYILKVSAKTEKSLREELKKYYNCIAEASDNEFLDILYAANRKRMDFDYRLTIAGDKKQDIESRLEKYISDGYVTGVWTNMEDKPLKKNRKMVFMYTGQGSQYVNMGRKLFETNAVFRDALLECDELFEPYTLESLTRLIYSENADADVIARTVYAQPLIFSIEYALTKMWESFGVKPQVVIGHSIGEFAAAVAAGSLTLKNAVKLVSVRGRLMDSAPGHGTMGTIFASEEVIEKLVEDYKDTVSIAVLNAKETCVISGNAEDVRAVLEKAKSEGLRTNELQVSHGFHSVLMRPILGNFDKIAQNIEIKKPAIRFISSLYAKELTDEDVFDHTYWTNHIAQKVDFYHAITSLGDPEEYIFLEIGSNTVLSAICKMIFGSRATIAGSLSMKKDDLNQIAECIAALYANGVDISWDNVSFHGVFTGNYVKLPTYSFDRNRYWLDPLYDRSGSSGSASDSVEFPGQKIQSPAMGEAVIMQSTFTDQRPYFMSEHIIFGTAISPAAAHISMLLSTAKKLKAPKAVCIKEMELRKPLAVGEDEARTVQVCIENNSAEESKFSILSQNSMDDSEEWITHTQGRIAILDEYFITDIQFDNDYLQSVPLDNDTDEILYGSMEETGFALGEGFRRVTKNYNVNGKGVCVIEPLKSIPDFDQFELYPGVIDSLLQTMLCTQYKNQKQKGIPKNNKTIIPYYIGKVIYNYIESDKLWCHVNINNEGDILYGEVTAFNERGEVIISIQDFMAKFTTQEVLLRDSKSNAKRLRYHNDWEKQMLVNSTTTSIKKSKYIIVSKNEDVFPELTGSLQDKIKNAVVYQIQIGDEFKKADNGCRISGLSKEDWRKALDELGKEPAYEAASYQFIYYNKSRNGVGLAEMQRVGELHLSYLLNLIAAIDSSDMKHKCKLKIVTQDTQKVTGDEVINLADSLIWGFSKVFSLEYANLFNGIVDCAENADKAMLLNEIVRDASDEVCLRGDQRYVARLIKQSDYLKKAGKSIVEKMIHSEGSYLITGGTGVVGLTYAEGLAELGAKNILLLNRKGPSEAAIERIAKIKNKGVTVRMVTADVTDIDSLKTAIANIPTAMLPVRGVIHAAGILKDIMISEAGWEDFKYVLNPKVTGAINLLQVLEKRDLDIFLMISSITSIIGNMGQSNYAAANYFMNQFACWMESNNLPGYSICWGPWDGGGMADRDVVTSNINFMGMEKLEVKAASELIKEYLQEPYNNLLVAEVNWKTLIGNLGNSGKKEYLSKLVGADKINEKSKMEDGHDFLKKLLDKPQGEREDFLLEEMKKGCCKIMGFDNTDMFEVDKALREQGADSLMLFSIRTAINKLLDMELDISVLYNYSTLRSLAEYLIEVQFREEAAVGLETLDLGQNTDSLLEELQQLID